MDTVPTKPDHDAYWRLATYKSEQKKTLQEGLKARNLTLPRNAKPSELIEVQQRLDRGSLYYDDPRITNGELSRFINDRRLQRPTFASRKAMVAVLMGADEVAVFDRFMDLPPELRMRIYRLHFKSHPRAIFCPTQPPITRTNTLVRREALSLFHRHHLFLLRLYFVTDGYKVGDNIIKGSLRPCYQTFQFLQILRSTSHSTPRIARFAIRLMAASSQETHQGKGIDIALLGAKDRPFKDGSFFVHLEASPQSAATMRPMKRLLDRHFNGDSTQGKIFSLEDIYKIRVLMETAFFNIFKKCGDWK